VGIRNWIYWEQIKNLQETFWGPLEVSQDHFLVTPPSHFTPQKVEGFVVGKLATAEINIYNLSLLKRLSRIIWVFSAKLN